MPKIIKIRQHELIASNMSGCFFWNTVYTKSLRTRPITSIARPHPSYFFPLHPHAWSSGQSTRGVAEVGRNPRLTSWMASSQTDAISVHFPLHFTPQIGFIAPLYLVCSVHHVPLSHRPGTPSINFGGLRSCRCLKKTPSEQTSCGCTSCGLAWASHDRENKFRIMQRAEYEYKSTIRYKEKLSKMQFTDELNDALLKKNMYSFWKSWQSEFSGKVSPVIDGLCKPSVIAENFADISKYASSPCSS